MSSIQLASLVQRSASSLPRLAAVAVLALLAGCEGDVTVDMTTEQPADPNITQVQATIRGLEFTGSSGTETLEFTDPQPLDFMVYADADNTFRLFSSEELPEGSYTGVRLLFEDDQDEDEAFVVVSGTDGGTFPMNLVAGESASINFEFEDNDSASEALTLMLDLRQSLSFNDDTDEFTFTPVLRAVPTEDIGTIEGNLSVTCPAGDSLVNGAVYLFQGQDVTPDDLDNAGVEPFATSPVFIDNTSFFYSLRVVPEGDYTMAVTCIGNDDDPASDEDLEFRNAVNVELDAGELLDRDLP
jgi:hypothetical protein